MHLALLLFAWLLLPQVRAVGIDFHGALEKLTPAVEDEPLGDEIVFGDGTFASTVEDYPEHGVALETAAEMQRRHHHRARSTTVHDADCDRKPLSRSRFVPGYTKFTKDQAVYTYEFTLPSGFVVLTGPPPGGASVAYKNLIGFDPMCATILVPGGDMTPVWYAEAAKAASDCAQAHAGTCSLHCTDEQRLACAFLGNHGQAKVWSFASDGPQFPPIPVEVPLKAAAEAEAKKARDAATALTEVIGKMTLRALKLSDVTAEFSYPYPASESYTRPKIPVYVVGGAVRDALMGQSAKIDDIDLMTPYFLTLARDRLVDIYGDKGVILYKDPTVLDAEGLRSNMGMLKVSKLTPDEHKPEFKTEISDLDVGVCKVHIVPYTYNNNIPPASDKEALDSSTIYAAGMSLASDTHYRDFGFNAVFFDIVNKVVIDTSGHGVADVAPAGSKTILSLVNQQEMIYEDYGGLLRFLRFLVKRGDDFKLADADDQSWGIVCQSLWRDIACRPVNPPPIYENVDSTGECSFISMLKDPLNNEEITAFKLYKMFGKLFKPKDSADQIKTTVDDILKKLNTQTDVCKGLAYVLKQFMSTTAARRASRDFPAETPKSAGVLTMMGAFRDTEVPVAAKPLLLPVQLGPRPADPLFVA